MAFDPTPKQAPALSPTEDRYWDPVDLDQELHRAFEICHSCRMCLSYCPSFPDLFNRIDGYIAAGKSIGAETINNQDIQSVVDYCFQCKLCYIKCPYTPDEKHAWALDFPRLMLREKAQRARRDGISLQDQILGEPQLLGELSSGPQAHIANFVNARSLVRKGIEKVAGISSKFPVPTFAYESFPSWWNKHKKHAESVEPIHGEVALFATCYGDYNDTAPTIAAVKVLEHLGVRVNYPLGQTCCGMPNLDGGDVASAQKKAKENIELFLPYVKKGIPIVIPSPTCGYVFSKEYAELVGTEEANLVSQNSIDLMRYIDVNIRRKKKLKKEFVNQLGKVAYHAPCHLRAQKIAFPSNQVLSAIGAEVEVVQECSAVDGTWGMKAQYYELGRRYAQKLLRGMRESEAKLLVSDCPLSARRIAFELGERCIHPIEALAHAYGLDVK